jgi:flavorubredoxin
MARCLAIRPGVFAVGVDDRESDLFEAYWPLPEGISYNATLIVDERIALVDAAGSPFLAGLLENVRAALPAGRGLDYLVVNHVEPDHAGGVGLLLAAYPQLKVVGNARTLELLAAYQGITERTIALADGELLDLGRRRLRAILTPMVHWPETMMTFEEREGILFTGDAFGSFGARGHLVSADAQQERLEADARRYFANVLGKYSGMVRTALARVDAAAPALLVPAHGPAWEGGGAQVRGWYERWSRHAAEVGAVVAYASMYQNTKRMAEGVAEGLAAAGVGRIAIHDVSRTHPAVILADLWRYGALALGSPTYNTEAFPAVATLVRLVRNKRMRNRLLGVFGSCGWSGGAVAELRALGDDPGWRLVEPTLEVRGGPTPGDLERCRGLGRALAAALPDVCDAAPVAAPSPN